MKSLKVSIHLEDCDFKEPKLDRIIRPLTTYFSESKTHIILKDFCLFLSESYKWKTEDILENFELEKQSLMKQYEIRNINVEKMLHYLEEAVNYGVSISRDKFNEVRGKLFEAVLIGVNGGIRKVLSQSRNMGWGVCLKIPSSTSKPIEFIDKTIVGKDNKKTFDFVYLNPKMNYLYECKISPNGLGPLEIGYFKKVQECFLNYELPFQICFFSSDNSFAVGYSLSKIKELEDVEIIGLGYDDVVTFVQNY